MYQNIQLRITGVESIPFIQSKFDRGDHFSFAQSQSPLVLLLLLLLTLFNESYFYEY